MNAFESSARKAIPAVLIYAKRGNDVLMIHRNSGRSGDYHVGKWNGLGGKCEPDESPLETARRELREESGLDLPADAFRPLGVLQFPNFKAHKNEDWIVFVFTATVSESGVRSLLKKSAEGELHWVRAKDLLSLSLWAGDRHFIPYVADEKPFMGTIWYKGEEVIRQWVTSLG